MNNSITPLPLKSAFTIAENEDFSSVETGEQTIPLRESTLLDYTKEILAPPTAIWVKDVPFGSLGGFSVITGKAKSRKTFLATMIMAGVLKPGLKKNAFQGVLPNDKRRVAFIDTEQARHEVGQVGKRMMQLCGEEVVGNFQLHTARHLSAKDRVAAIDDILFNTEGLGLVVIDGARDLLMGINDDKEASFIVGKFLQWSTIQNIHIITIIHQNKSDSNARGHIGTELINKAETVLSVEPDKKNKDVSNVRPTYCRGEEFETFAFGIDSDGLPEVVENYIANSSGRNKITPSTLADEEHLKIIEELNRGLDTNKPNYSQIVDQLRSILKSKNYPSGDNKAKEFLKYYSDSGQIIRIGKSNSPNSYYNIQEV